MKITEINRKHVIGTVSFFIGLLVCYVAVTKSMDFGCCNSMLVCAGCQGYEKFASLIEKYSVEILLLTGFLYCLIGFSMLILTNPKHRLAGFAKVLGIISCIAGLAISAVLYSYSDIYVFFGLLYLIFTVVFIMNIMGYRKKDKTSDDEENATTDI